VRWIRDESDESAHGYLVEVGEEALLGLQQLGVASEVLDAAEQVSSVRWVNARGHAIAGLRVSAAAAEPPYVLRETLERILLSSLPPNVRIYRGTSIRDVRLQADGVQLMLSSGERVRADLLVGADGARSRVRELVFGNEGLWQRPLGHHSAAFVFEDRKIHDELGGHLTVVSAPGRMLALCPLRDARVAATFAFRASRDVNPKSAASWLKFVFGDLSWCAPSVLEHALSAKGLRYDRATEIKTCTWQRARAALLGDACHAYSVLPGQGCATRIAAAVHLGNDLVRGVSFEQAFTDYESRLTRELLLRRIAARRMASWLMPESRVSWAFRNGFLRMAHVPGVRRLLGSGDLPWKHLALREA
jgi:2-polyprenyl-6-methoxyphenol hydroxylase-like FAD-dependent oxidoreductase